LLSPLSFLAPLGVSLVPEGKYGESIPRDEYKDGGNYLCESNIGIESP
jgi:hypothetical protein